MPVTINLVGEKDALVAAIKAQLKTINPAIIVLDTLNRSFAGSESSDQDMSAYVKAADVLRETFECAVVVIHHCGHDASRARGHTALIGAADAVIAVRKDDATQVITTTLELMKDGPADQVFASRLEAVELGFDEDGQAITSCVVEPVEITEPAKRGPKAPKLSNTEQIALKALQYAISEAGEHPPASNHIPQDVRVVPLDRWREYARRQGISQSEEKRANNQAFKRAFEGLLAKKRVGYWEPLAWIV